MHVRVTDWSWPFAGARGSRCEALNAIRFACVRTFITTSSKPDRLRVNNLTNYATYSVSQGIVWPLLAAQDKRKETGEILLTLSTLCIRVGSEEACPRCQAGVQLWHKFH